MSPALLASSLKELPGMALARCEEAPQGMSTMCTGGYKKSMKIHSYIIFETGMQREAREKKKAAGL
jgi:hypothetical protein